MRNLGMKIYTKTGDSGSTSLLGGSRISKSDLRIETYGTVDELNSHIGILRADAHNETSQKAFLSIQDRLFTMGSHLAMESGKSFAIPSLVETDVVSLEEGIDSMNSVIPPMKHFILPGSNMSEAQAHVARCVCRRAERLVVALSEHETINPLIQKYLNRLSDYLFVYARFITHNLGKEETPWIPNK